MRVCATRAPGVLVALLLLYCAAGLFRCSAHSVLPSNGQHSRRDRDVKILDVMWHIEQRLLSGPMTIRCTGGGIIVSKRELQMQDVTLLGCSRAIRVLGPNASLSARNVTFIDSNSSSGLGSIIWAVDAAVHLHNVTIVNTSGGLATVAISYSQDCTAAALNSTHRNNSSAAAPEACWSPVLANSLLHLECSSAVISSTIIENNTASALITVAGSNAHNLTLANGTTLHNNTVTWLVVADSMRYDPVAVDSIMAPEPGDREHKVVRLQPEFTVFDMMGHVSDAVGATHVQPAFNKSLLDWRRAGKGQVPLHVLIQDTLIEGNSAVEGLLWLRAVNTSLHNTSITYNTAGTPGTHTNLPSRDCAPKVGQPAMLLIHGPAPFDMYSCNISGNIHHSGALLRVTDGFALTSIRSSTFCSNTASTVLRFEGRTWVLDWYKYTEAEQFLDVGRFAEVPWVTKKEDQRCQAYEKDMEAQKQRSTFFAPWYMADCNIVENTVYHAIIASIGHHSITQARKDCGSPRVAGPTNRQTGLVPSWHGSVGQSTSAHLEVPTLDTMSSCWWMEGCAVVGNKLLDSAAGVNPQQDTGACEVNPAVHSSGTLQLDWGGYRLGTLAPAPVVLQTNFSNGYLWATNFSTSTNFRHVLNMDNTRVTMQHVDLKYNNVSWGAVNCTNSNVWWMDGTMQENRVSDQGSVMSVQYAKIHIEQVEVVDNAAGADQEQQDKQAAEQSTPALPNSTSNCGICRAPVWYLWNVENVALHSLVFKGNRGLLVLDMVYFNLGQPHGLDNITIKNNVASGMRLTQFKPSFINDSILVQGLVVAGNILKSAKVGALAIGGFGSKIHTRLPVTIINSSLLDNRPWPWQTLGLNATDTVLQALQGGGLKIDAPTDASHPSEHGLLEGVDFSIINTTISNNVAAEGGGVWSVWPFSMSNCTVSGNKAINAGGGMYLRGMRRHYLGLGTSHITDSIITNNTASFGGGLACDSCRAVVSAAVTHNRAETDVTNDLGESGSRNTHNNSSSLDSCGWVASCDSDSSIKLMEATPRGVGGGVAANMANDTKSYLIFCGSQNNSIADSSTAASLANNNASVLGGAVYVNDSTPTDVHASAASPHSLCAASVAKHPAVQSGHWGIVLYDVPMEGSTAAFAGRLEVLGLSSTVAGSGEVPGVSEGGQSQGFSHFTCARATDIAGNGTNADGCHLASGRISVGEVFMPSQVSGMQLHVYDTVCLAKAETHADAATVCELESSGKPSPPYFRPYVSAGHSLNLTASLKPLSGTNVAQLGCGDRATNRTPGYGRVALDRNSDEHMVVIGHASQDLEEHDAAVVTPFCNLTIQPVDLPTQNNKYALGFGYISSNAIMDGVQNATVFIQVLRCTMGQFMALSRCIDCPGNGSYSLHPNMSCLACPTGGVCTNGLLVPGCYSYSFNPFVPQIIPCPLRAGCGRPAKNPADCSYDRSWIQYEQLQKNLQCSGLNAKLPSPNAAARGSRCSSLLHLLGGANKSDARTSGFSRSEALMLFQCRLADALIHSEGNLSTPLLLGTEYSNILRTWHDLQCSPGYTGMFCASCNSAYAVNGNTSNTTAYGKYLNQCVPCSSMSVALGVFAGFYILWCAYMALPVVMQLHAPQPSMSIGSGTSAASPKSQVLLQQGSRSARVAPVPAATSLGSQQSRLRQAAEPCVQDDIPGSALAPSDVHVNGQQPGIEMAHVLPQQQSSSLPLQPFSQQRQLLDPCQDLHTTSAASSVRQQAAGPAATTAAARPVSPALPMSVRISIQPSVSSPKRALSAVTPSVSESASIDDPKALVVAVWKILTTYVQVVAMVRYLGIPLPPQITGLLTYPDLSSFSSYLSTDCILYRLHNVRSGFYAYARVIFKAVLLPAILIVTFAACWLATWFVRWVLSSLWGSLHHSSIMQTPKTALATVQIRAASMHTMRPRQQLWILLVGYCRVIMNKLQKIRAWVVAVLWKLSLFTYPGPLKRYVAVKMSVTVLVLCYSCYPLMVSSWLEGITCQYINIRVSNPTSGVERGAMQEDPIGVAAASTSSKDIIGYGRLQRDWLYERAVCSAKSPTTSLKDALHHASMALDAANIRECNSNSIRAAHGPFEEANMTYCDVLKATEPCRVGAVTLKVPKDKIGAYCLVSGYFWRQDYDVTCYDRGSHYWMEVLGSVMLALLCLLAPLVVGSCLWNNRRRLDDWDFALKYSFLYSEYHPKLCYWESVVTLRKCLFLAVTILLPMSQQIPPAVTTVVQLMLGNVLAVFFLACQEWLKPYNSTLLNNLERLGLSATALTYALLACAVVEALQQDTAVETLHPEIVYMFLCLVAALNGVVMVWFCYQLVYQVWSMLHGPIYVRLIRSWRRWSLWLRRRISRLRYQRGAHQPVRVCSKCVGPRVTSV